MPDRADCFIFVAGSPLLLPSGRFSGWRPGSILAQFSPGSDHHRFTISCFGCHTDWVVAPFFAAFLVSAQTILIFLANGVKPCR